MLLLLCCHGIPVREGLGTCAREELAGFVAVSWCRACIMCFFPEGEYRHLQACRRAIQQVHEEKLYDRSYLPLQAQSKKMEHLMMRVMERCFGKSYQNHLFCHSGLASFAGYINRYSGLSSVSCELRKTGFRPPTAMGSCATACSTGTKHANYARKTLRAGVQDLLQSQWMSKCH